VMLASVPIDLQVHDSYFVVAHLHYVLIGGAIFPLFGAFYYWFPKWTGRMLDARLGWWNLGLLFAGFNLTFYPMHHLGLLGMPRRVYTYVAESGWAEGNLIATIGAGVLGLAVLALAVNVIWSRRHGRIAGDDPWHAGGLEWATSSPPPRYNFVRLLSVRGRYPLWEHPEEMREVIGLSVDHREVLVTRLHDAAPDHRYHQSGDSYWPPFVALLAAASLIGFIFHPVALAIGIPAMLIALGGWFWHTHEPKPITPAGELGMHGYEADA
jgi:cytochrome c oxidase subunit I+III